MGIDNRVGYGKVRYALPAQPLIDALKTLAHRSAQAPSVGGSTGTRTANVAAGNVNQASPG